MPSAFHSRGWPWLGVSCLALVGVDFATLDSGFCLADFLGRDLGDRPVSRACLAVAWSTASPHGLAREDLGGRFASWTGSTGPGWSLRLADSLGRDLGGHPASRSCSACTSVVALHRGLARHRDFDWSRRFYMPYFEYFVSKSRQLSRVQTRYKNKI